MMKARQIWSRLMECFAAMQSEDLTHNIIIISIVIAIIIIILIIIIIIVTVVNMMHSLLIITVIVIIMVIFIRVSPFNDEVRLVNHQ